MPLGKLSRRQIETAFTLLGAASRMVRDGAQAANIRDVTNQFYTLIPHDFGSERPRLLDNDALIGDKTDMLTALLDIEVACRILAGELVWSALRAHIADDKYDCGDRDPIDVHYEKLNTNIEVCYARGFALSILTHRWSTSTRMNMQ
jgi:poly [ADP-ribose] polymerase